MEGRWSQLEASHIASMTRCSAVGSPATIRRELEALLKATAADEIMCTAQIFDHAARLRSFEIAAGVLQEMSR
jgi:alkanesulfonate monooxygenase SsuD/methylene tetrahydromethanopterin reductase-like flavin-dependent oxidoreductase (luciferase family)